jgi:hypothetical protein
MNDICTMRFFRTLIFIAALAATSCGSKHEYDPSGSLTAREKDAIMTSTVRYFAKRPEDASEANKFDPKYDKYYQEKIKETRFEKYYATEEYYYFMVTQIAPSLIEKRHATGGRFKLNDQGEITYYEEVFRTWKMVPDTLARRSSILFDKMVKGEPLEQYQTKNSKGTEYIEFPDDVVYYDTSVRQWKMK